MMTKGRLIEVGLFLDKTSVSSSSTKFTISFRNSHSNDRICSRTSVHGAMKKQITYYTRSTSFKTQQFCSIHTVTLEAHSRIL